jgi:chromosome segregation and condensation protein ScpB
MKRNPLAGTRQIFARLAVQVLFVSGQSFTIESLREQVGAALAECGDGRLRGAGALSNADCFEALLEAGDRLQSVGLQLEVAGGSVRMSTLPVEAQSCANLLDSYQPQKEESKGQDLTETALLVLSTVAYKQPVTMSEVSRLLGQDVRYQVDRLRALGLVAAVRAEGVAALQLVTTPAFAARFGDPGHLPPI